MNNNNFKAKIQKKAIYWMNKEMNINIGIVENFP